MNKTLTLKVIVVVLELAIEKTLMRRWFSHTMLSFAMALSKDFEFGN